MTRKRIFPVVSNTLWDQMIGTVSAQRTPTRQWTHGLVDRWPTKDGRSVRTAGSAIAATPETHAWRDSSVEGNRNQVTPRRSYSSLEETRLCRITSEIVDQVSNPAACSAGRVFMLGGDVRHAFVQKIRGHRAQSARKEMFAAGCRCDIRKLRHQKAHWMLQGPVREPDIRVQRRS